MNNYQQMQARLRETIRLASEKGAKVESIGMSTGWWLTLPSQPRKRIPGVSKLISTLEDFLKGK